ncbi:hypothetical protein [Sorangium sp. So ce1153]|uniref:hypothetical protein n=1 Tax=Sorangium sp. So ce1153 TaxID=3133333 RepID=UPI003F6434A1
MWKELGASGVLLVIGALWGACAGETHVDVEVNGEMACDDQADCDAWGFGWECAGGACWCPEGTAWCCAQEPGSDSCNRACHSPGACTDEHHVDAPASCEIPEDCPGPASPRCGRPTCVANVCGLALAPEAATQRAGDCVVVKCSEKGEAFDAPDPGDVFNDGNECTIDRCDEVRMSIVNEPYPRGTAPESSGYCDGQGHWVGCLLNADCGHPELICSRGGSCILRHCEDGILSTLQGETAIDCGGPCDPCPSGQPCNQGTDCIEGVCSDNRCARAACDDEVRNGSEGDVDCGGPSCVPCGRKKRCAVHDDCASGVCSLGQCQEQTCGDGVKNGTESDVDCGGVCPPCGTHAARSETSASGEGT